MAQTKKIVRQSLPLLNLHINSQKQTNYKTTSIPRRLSLINDSKVQIQQENSLQTTAIQQTSIERNMTLEQYSKFMENINQDSLFDDKQSLTELFIHDEGESLFEEEDNIVVKRKPKRYYGRINQSQILNQIEDSFKKNHPDFQVHNYLSDKNAKQYRHKLEVQTNNDKLPVEYRRIIGKLQRDQFNTKVAAISLPIKVEQIKLPRLHERKLIQNKYNIRSLIDTSMDQLPALQTQNQPVSLQNIYSKQFKFKAGRMVMKNNNEIKSIPLQTQVSTQNKATNILVEFYNRIAEEKQRALESRSKTISDNINFDEIKYLKSYRDTSLYTHRTEDHINSKVQRKKLSKVLLDETDQLIEKINKMDTILKKKVQITQQKIRFNRFEQLQKRIKRREQLMNNDITNLLMLAHDDEFMENLKIVL